MGSLFKADVVRTAENEIGYVGGYHTSKYSSALDAVNYWNMGAKDGAADWCSIFVNFCIWASTRNSSGDIDPDVWDAHFFTFEPDGGQNLAAGVGFAADYYMAHDSWSGDSSGACVGDQIFFRNFAHTGLVVGWGTDDNGVDYIDTIEGNATIDGVPYSVGRRRYRADDPQIDGYGHPRYDGDDYPESSNTEPTPEPVPEPEPDPVPDPIPEPPTSERYKVTTNGGILRLRAAPNTDSAYLIGIPNGTELDVTEIVDGESINWCEEWARTCYGGYNGFVSCAWITKI